MQTKILKWAVWTVVAAIVLTAAIHRNPELAAAKAALADAQETAQTARSDAHTALVRMAHADSVAAVKDRVAKALAARADSLTTRLKTERATFEIAAAAAPDTCKIVVEDAKIALASADSVAQVLRRAVVTATERGDSLQSAIDSSVAPVRRLIVADSTVGRAATAVVHAAEPSFFARIRPKLGVGFALGVDPAQKVNVVAGLTLGWTW